MASSSRKSSVKRNSTKKSAKSKINSLKKALSSMKHDNIDVKTVEQVDKLIEHIKGNVVTLLLIYADWCGHCGTFKKDVWEKLASVKGRKMPMAQINEKVLSQLKEHIPDLKIDGYPTVSLIGKDMKAAEMTDPTSGEKSNAMPNTRDMGSMTKLVTANPSQVVANNGTPVEDMPRSASPTAESLVARKNAGEEALNNLNSGMPNITPETSSTVPNPPNVEDDLADSQEPVESGPKTPKTPPIMGGALYASLLEATRHLAVPAGLLAAGVAVSRRLKAKRKGTKKPRRRR